MTTSADPASSESKRSTTYYATRSMSLAGKAYATGDVMPELCCDTVTAPNGATFQRDVFDQLYITDQQGRHWQVSAVGNVGHTTATFNPRYTPEHTTLADLAARGLATSDRKLAERLADLERKIAEAAEADRVAGTREHQPPLVKQLAELREQLVQKAAA